MIEEFVIFITGFALGWGSVWFTFSMKEIKEIEIITSNIDVKIDKDKEIDGK